MIRRTCWVLLAGIIFYAAAAEQPLWQSPEAGRLGIGAWDAGFRLLAVAFPAGGSGGLHDNGSQFMSKQGLSERPFNAGSTTNLTGLSMTRMLLYPPTSAWAFVPAAFMLPTNNATNSTLIMTNCTISTLCSTLGAYVSFLNATDAKVGHWSGEGGMQRRIPR